MTQHIFTLFLSLSPFPPKVHGYQGHSQQPQYVELAFTRGQTAHGGVTGVGGSVVGVSKGQFPGGNAHNPTMYATIDHPHRQQQQQHMAHSPNCPLKVSKALSGSKKGA